MEAIKRVRWKRVVLVFLVLLIIVVGIVAIEHKSGTSRLEGSSTKTITATVTRVGQSLQLAPQPTHMLTTRSSRIPTPTLSPSPTVNSNSPQWQLIFSDDFNGSSLGSGWGAYNGPHGSGQSFYSPSEVKVQNGLLQLGMEKKTTNGLPYTTGGVGAFRYMQTYGKYEFRVRLP